MRVGVHTRSIPSARRGHTGARERAVMDTTKKTRTTALTIALAAMLAAGLGACAKADVDTFAERRASDLSHEVQRAENRVDAFAARSQYRDQAERRTGIETPSDSESHYQDQVERRMRVLR
jgi:hypothetical protein